MITGKQLRDAFISGARSIANHRHEVDELNVFPVPDGDTGTNMSMTIGSALPELTALPDSCTVETVASVTASALLRGARGNSGVILSLLFRGFSRAMRGKEQAGTEDFIFAFSKGVDYAYKAVMKPTEGTILTVARVAAEKAAENPSAQPLELWDMFVKTAEETLETTPELLPVLKKAGVVDSGGKGYCFIARAIYETLKTGNILELAEPAEQPAAKPNAGVFSDQIDPNLANAYCTEFLVMKDERANHPRLRAYLESIGDSVVCVDDSDLIKCHVHTALPGKALNEALRHGYLSKIKIENMAEQYAARQAEARAAESGDRFEYVAPESETDYAFVAVAAGDGVRSVFSDLGVQRVVSVGQTMNPSAEDILNAVQSVAAKNILILANNKNIIMSAEQAVRLADRHAVVVPTRTIPQGISALLAFDETQPLEANLENMTSAFKAVTTGEITYASRTTEFDGKKIKENETLALVDGKLAFTAKSCDEAAAKLIKKLCGKDSSFLTVIYGEGISGEQAGAMVDSVREKIDPEIEINVIDGGMPVYYYYISVE